MPLWQRKKIQKVPWRVNNMTEKRKSFESLLIIDRPELQEFIKDRKIRPEDFHLIEELATFPRDLVITELHNLFNMYHERSGGELERIIKNTEDVSKKSLCEKMLQFYQAYDWATSWNLERLLEKNII